MSNRDKLNWATDLRRIALWLQSGNITLANNFIERGRKLYAKGEKVGGREWEWWFTEISRKENLKAAERALTWSLLLR